MNVILSAFRKKDGVFFVREKGFFVAKAGFSLLELLVVMGVIALLIGLSVPAISSTLRASHLNTASQTVIDQLSFARQSAMSRQLPVEVRFYNLPDYDSDSGSSPKSYRALQSFVYDDSGAQPLSRVQYFSSPVIISSDTSQSSLFDIVPESGSITNIPVYGKNYRYRSVYFKPSGSLNVQGSNLCLTVLLGSTAPLSQVGNFSTIQIDSHTGRIQTFRP
jgi:uncharacterized protein (TIGR02596 family)